MNKAEVCDWIEKNKIIAICRKIYGDDLARLTEALAEGGVKMIEVTFDQADPRHLEKTAEAIELISRVSGSAVLPGAGTVMSLEQLETARQAGALYIISPNTNEKVIRATVEKSMVSIPGAMTPSEIAAAHEYGADFVKLFPTSYLGLDYIKAVRAPISHVKLVATGGIKEDNLADYLNAGMVGAGVSGRLTDAKLIREGDFAEITRRAAAFAAIAGGEG